MIVFSPVMLSMFLSNDDHMKRVSELLYIRFPIIRNNTISTFMMLTKLKEKCIMSPIAFSQYKGDSQDTDAHHNIK